MYSIHIIYAYTISITSISRPALIQNCQENSAKFEGGEINSVEDESSMYCKERKWGGIWRLFRNQSRAQSIFLQDIPLIDTSPGSRGCQSCTEIPVDTCRSTTDCPQDFAGEQERVLLECTDVHDLTPPLRSDQIQQSSVWLFQIQSSYDWLFTNQNTTRFDEICN